MHAGADGFCFTMRLSMRRRLAQNARHVSLPFCCYSCVGNRLKQAFFWRPISPQETQGKKIAAGTTQAADWPLTTHIPTSVVKKIRCDATVITVLSPGSRETYWSFHKLQTEHDMEIKLAPINFSRRVAKGSRSSWLQILGNQLINRSPYIRDTNQTYYLLYSTTWER